MDENLKKQFEVVLDDIGMNVTTALTVFAKAVVRDNGIPFELKADPFWRAENQARIQESIDQLNRGNVIVKTMEELEAMENG